MGFFYDGQPGVRYRIRGHIYVLATVGIYIYIYIKQRGGGDGAIEF